MINTVRQTVLSLLNKSNFGYMTPLDFNLYAKQAQLEVFDELFSTYNDVINRENSRVSGTEYADRESVVREMIDFFVVQLNDQPQANPIPDNLYMLNRVALTGSNYEAENLPAHKIPLLNASHLTAPSVQFPAYTLVNDVVTVYPDNATNIDLTYVRYPATPKWTYVTLQNGEALFDESAADYQDFELSLDFETHLIRKICQYAGLEIREDMVIAYAKGEETEQKAQG